MSEPIIQTFRAPTGSNYSTSVGLIVNLTAVATGEARCTLLTASDDGTLSNLPLGVITYAENANGGAVSVCVAGPCKVMAGAALTPGTDGPIMCNNASKAIAATDGNFILGRFTGKQVAADTHFVDCIVQPGNLENT